MRMRVLNVIVLFVVETLLQVIYYSIEIKYFESFQSLHTFYDIFVDTLYVVGTIKAAFFLPAYIVYYLWIAKTFDKGFTIGLVHAGIFLFIFLILGLILPGELLKRFVDVILLTAIAFIVAYTYVRYTSFKRYFSLNNIG